MVKNKSVFQKQHEFLKVNYGIWFILYPLSPPYMLSCHQICSLISWVTHSPLPTSWRKLNIPGGMLKISRKHHTAGSSELPHFWVVPPFLSFRGAALSTHLPWQISQGLVRQISLLESEAHLAALPVPAWLWSLCPVSSLTDSHIAPCSSDQDLNPGFSPASSVVMVTQSPDSGQLS